MSLKLALRLDLYRAAKLRVPIELVLEAERLGFHSVWSAEAYGTDALSPLAYLAARTERIGLGTAVVQLAARPPATLAMHAMTIDALAGGGRVIIGVGVSGPQIVEGWYGQPWGHPTQRLRDYIAIVRKVIDRSEPVTHDGPEISLPYTGPGAIGQGKPLRSILHAVAPIPIWMASGGPRNTELCAEVCDGWLPMGLPREGLAAYGDELARGFARRTDGSDGGRLRDVRRVQRRDHRRRGRRPRPHAPPHRHVRRRDGQLDPQLPPRRHGPAGVPRAGRPDPGVVAGRSQRGGGAHRP
jgi:F420-dependent oxidoreductase-like protein